MKLNSFFFFVNSISETINNLKKYLEISFFFVRFCSFIKCLNFRYFYKKLLKNSIKNVPILLYTLYYTR